MQYNKIVSKINSNTENIELTFEDQSSARCDYLVVSDGIFSSTKSLILNRDIKPKYFKSIAIRGTINKEDLDSIDCSNISLFLGSNFHSVIYPVNKDNKLNFIGILRKNLSEDQLKDHLKDHLDDHQDEKQQEKKLQRKTIHQKKDCLKYLLLIYGEMMKNGKNIKMIIVSYVSRLVMGLK